MTPSASPTGSPGIHPQLARSQSSPNRTVAASSQPLITADLCDAFLSAADDLVRRRADDVPEASVAPFIQLRWMERQGDMLRLTMLGRMALSRARSQSRDSASAR